MPTKCSPPISQNELNNAVIKEIGYKGMKYLKHNQGWLPSCSQAIIPSCSLAASQKKYFIPKKLQAKQKNKTEKQQKKLHPGEKKHPKTKKKQTFIWELSLLVLCFKKNTGTLQVQPVQPALKYTSL